MMRKLASVLRREEGVTAIEYGLIASLISIAIIFAVGNVGSQLRRTFNTIAAELESANNKGP